MQVKGACDGLRVIDFSWWMAGPLATMVLADNGADVIKVEPPAGGEIRRLPPFPDDRPHVDTGACHLALDTGKRSVV
ncbi:MAG: CoA transferase, partial [Chloroflexi bacterium]|nr:CoA transferase [Chloroflexota bacterium]